LKQPTLSDIQSRVRAWAQMEPLIRRVYLFGSRARSEERPDSDIDLAVLYHLDQRLLRECGGNRDVAHWEMGGHRTAWRKSFTGAFAVPVHLELYSLGDLYVSGGLRRSRVLIYRRGHNAGERQKV
jgi:predicted nucleotidyltransferase